MEPLEQQLASLSPAQRQLVALWLRQEQTGAHQPATRLIPRRPQADTAPLSFAQQRLWFLDQLEPGQALYNVATSLRLRGALDLPALSHSLTTLAARHEPLRTHFASIEGQPVQVIAPIPTLALRLVDLQSLPTVERAAQEQRLVTVEARRPFDLGQGPLLRVWVLRLAAEDHLLLLTLHHIVADTWSLGLLVRELSILYRARLTRQPASLPELPIQYADYALWQRQWLMGAVLEAQLAYWRQQLAGLPPLALPSDHPPPPQPSGQGATVPLQLPFALGQALVALSRREGVTLFMTLLAAFQTLLFRYSGQADIAVGSPIANRTRAEVEDLIGFFVNTLVLRTDLSGTPSFLEVLARVREVTLGAYAHQDLPFELLVAELQPERDLSRSPLFQVLLVLQNVPQAAFSIQGLSLEPVAVATGTAKFDLTLALTETAQGLRGWLEYRTDLFDAATIRRLAGHFQTLLAGLASSPAQHIGDLPLLSEAERLQLLVEWNAMAEPYPQLCVHELLEAQAAQTPDAVALVFQQQQLSYRALNARANQLAHQLRGLGVGPEVLVGLCLERSPELVVALLGVLKAGGAYVPLDPSYPRERLAFMLADSQLQVLLTTTDDRRPTTDDQGQPAHPFTGSPVHPIPDTRRPTPRVVCLDCEWPAIAAQPASAPASGVSGDNLAYVIYTSGSTGRPKGVQIPHHALINFLASMRRRPGLSATDTLLAITTLAFDIAGLELFLPLTVGARLVVVGREIASDGEQLSHALRLAHATVMQATPATWRLLEAGWPELPQLRLLCGGEALPLELAVRLLGRGAALWNLYGPTETTIWSTAAVVSSAKAPVGIGRPIDNTQVYLLDQRRQVVPVGVIGELYIGGAGLARGYLNRPDLTAERFVPNPFAAQRPTTNNQRPTNGTDDLRSSFVVRRSSRLYRTGDLARYLPDGNIEFQGRRDQQVKVRGYRIELGEIEAQLGQHTAVQACVVLAREDTPGHKRLVAYIVPTNDQRPATSEDSGPSFVVRRSSFVGELRAFLKDKLPDYMIPAAFVWLSALPLTPNGKVDRRALPAPHLDHDGLAAGYVPPRTAQEAIIAQVWAQVLGMARVGIHDNFFAIGGDSFLALQLVARLRQAGLSIAPRQLFSYQTIADLVPVLDTTPLVQADQGIITGPLPLTDPQSWLLDQGRAEALGSFWKSMRMFDVPPDMNAAALAQVTAHLLRHHDGLRARFVRTDSGWQAFIAPPDDQVPFKALDLSAVPDHDLRPAMEQQSRAIRARIDLAEGLLLQIVYFDCGLTRTGRLLVLIHHLLVDEFSMWIVLDDLLQGYQQLQAGEALQLPRKTTPLPVWTARLNAYAQSPELRTSFEAWSQLPWNAIPQLPRDFPTLPEVAAINSVRDIHVALGYDETQVLLRLLPQRHQAQLREALVAALLYALQQWSPARWFGMVVMEVGRDDLPGAEDLDVSRTVGWFAHGRYVILERPVDSEPGALLEATVRQLRRNPGLRYDLLRFLSHDPTIVEPLQSLQRYEILFNYIGQMPVTERPLPVRPSVEQRDIRNTDESASYVLECRPIIINGQLNVQWIYSERLHRRATIERLGQMFLDFLHALAADAAISGQ